MEKPNFKKMCLMYIQQLTNFPYIEKDFDALTDYQLLCKVVSYLNKIIVNENTQNDAITALYNAFVELKDYVDNYFDNLDVQDEINNKLDKMVEDGILEQIIEQYLNSSAIWGFDNVDEMKQATNLINGSFARTLGYYEINDGGGATYKITNVESETDYQESLENGLYASLIVKDYLNIKQIGIKEDEDETTLFQEIVNKYNKIYIPTGNYILNNITISSNTRIKSQGTITTSINDYIFKLIEVDNITIDGGNYKGQNTNDTQTLIQVSSCNNCVFKNMKLSQSLNKGISVGGNSTNNLFENIKIKDNLSPTGVGLSLFGADVKYNTINNLYTSNNRIGLSLNGASYNNINDDESYQDIIMGVTVDGIITGAGDGGSHNNFNNIIINELQNSTYAPLYIGNSSSYNNFSNINITNSLTTSAIRQTHSEENNGISNNFTNVLIKNCKGGIAFSGAKYSTISNFTIKEITGRGIYLGRSDNCCINNGIIDSCTTEGIFIQNGYTNLNNIKVKNNNEGIEIAFGLTQPTNNIISNIDFENNTIKDFIGVGTYIINNCTGYVVSNFGKISKANSQNIAHGLSNTPIYVNAVSSNANHNVSIINITETYFTISLTDNDGNAITTAEDIYWEAKCK